MGEETPPKRVPLGEILVQQGLATSEDIERALELQKLGDQRPLGSILLSQTEIGSEELARALAVQFGMAYVDLAEVTVDPAATALIPAEFAWRYIVLPYAFESGCLLTAVFDPIYTDPLRQIAAMTGVKVRPTLTMLESIQQALRQVYRHPQTKQETLQTPPLHKRKDDVRRLLGLFLKDFSGRDERSRVMRISRLALETLLDYPWTGVRELLDAVEEASRASPLDVIRLQHLPERVRRYVAALKKQGKTPSGAAAAAAAAPAGEVAAETAGVAPVATEAVPEVETAADADNLEDDSPPAPRMN